MFINDQIIGILMRRNGTEKEYKQVRKDRKLSTFK